MKIKKTIIELFRLILDRLKRLPVKFWALLATIFGIADFLTWSILSSIPKESRLNITLVIVIATLCITLIAVIRQPTSDEVVFHARELYRSAREHYENKKFSDALSLLQASIELDPDSTATIGLLGRCLVKLGRFEEALKHLSLAINKTVVPANRRTFRINRAISNIMLRDFGSAMNDLDDNISEEPDLKISYRQRAVVWLCMGRPQNALVDLSKVITKNPKYLCGRATRAVAYAMVGDSVNALKEVERVEKLLPKDADHFYCFSLALTYLGRFDDSVSALAIAMERDSKYIPRARKDPLLDPIRENQLFIDVIRPIINDSLDMAQNNL